MEITREFLSTFLSYNRTTGLFLRKRKDGSWTPTGGVNASIGYRVIGIGHRPYLAHRLAFVLMTGAWPADTVDHINGDRTDNRWANLRDVPMRVNAENKRSDSRSNPQKLLGVSHWPKRWGTKT